MAMGFGEITGGRKKKAVEDCCCEGGCPCCRGWPAGQSGIINWISVVESNNDCEISPSPVETSTDFGCPSQYTETGQIIRSAATELWVRVFCDSITEKWSVQYRSATTGGGFESPVSPVWKDVNSLEFICPDCQNKIDGIAYGTIDFIAEMACETSGGIVAYNVLVHGNVEIGCGTT
jgi:hypothetical protein